MPQRLRSSRVFRKAQSPSAEFPAVLFDLDGTLIDSNYQHVSTWWQALRETKVTIPRWKIDRRIGVSGKSFLQELLREQPGGRRKYDLQKLEKRHDLLFRRQISDLPPLPGANELLAHLAKHGVRIAIATTGGREQTSRLLRQLRIPSQIEVVTGDEAMEAKPSPDIFMAAGNKLGVPVSDCIVVGDSASDLLAAGRKSALGAGLLSGGYGEDELERAGAFRIYSDAADMLQQLGLPGE